MARSAGSGNMGTSLRFVSRSFRHFSAHCRGYSHNFYRDLMMIPLPPIPWSTAQATARLWDGRPPE